MSTTLSSITHQIIIYGATPVFIAGVLGGLLNTLVFFSLRTFRQSSCAIYLSMMSMFDVFNLFLGLFSRITLAFMGVDGTETSLFYCKTRLFFSQTCIGMSMTCLCLATIDQYFATCSNVRWQQWCNIKLAQRLIIIGTILWSLHGIPYIVYYDHVVSPTTNQTTCTSTSNSFTVYRGFVVLLMLIGYVPAVINAVFGWMAYRNVQQMAHRTVPLVRQALDRQLTVMVLAQVVANIFTLIPYVTVSTVATNPNLNVNPIVQANVQLAITITLIFYYATFASPFYIYICASERFRRQLIYVLFTVHLNRCKRATVMPEA